MSDFAITRLPPNDARLAYPLVRLVDPSVELAAWLAFARAARGKRRGIIVATRLGRPYPSGMFHYCFTRDLTLGRVVTADYFVALDILDPRPLANAMVAALEALARGLACDAVRSVVRDRTSLLADCLLANGHAPEASVYVKTLSQDYTNPLGR